MAAPWTEIGRIQSDVSELQRCKANRCDLDTLRSTVVRLECSLREACAEVDGLRNRVSDLEQEIGYLKAEEAGDGSQRR